MATKKPKATKKTAAPALRAAKPKPGADPLLQAFRQEYAPPPRASSNVVTLDADVAPHFQNSRAVNEALRALLRIVRQVRDTGS